MRFALHRPPDIRRKEEQEADVATPTLHAALDKRKFYDCEDCVQTEVKGRL